MKKLFLGFVALAAMVFASSCQQEKMESVAGGSKVTYTVEVPGVQTRAEIGDGMNVNQLIYEVWRTERPNDKTLQEKTTEPKTERLYTATADVANGVATFEVDLVNNQNYTILFWAQVKDRGYYNTSDLRAVTLTEKAVNAFDEQRAAFFGIDFIESEKPRLANKTVELTRPFGQINLGTVVRTQEQQDVYELNVANTSVVVKGASTKFNVATGVASNDDCANLSFADAAPYNDEQFKAGYQWIAMNYIFVPANQATLEVDYVITTNHGTVSNTVGNVPTQINYRTNIFGNLLTSKTDYRVELKADWDDQDLDGGKYGAIDGLTYAKVENAAEFQQAFTDGVDNIILWADINLNDVQTRATVTDPTFTVNRELIIDLNGKKLSATSSATGKNYNLFTVKNGTLTVKNGSIEYKHEGSNMAWNNSTNIFHVEKATLNLEGVTAKNLGGSDMAFVAHLNNWGEVTINVNNSTLESTYIPVRVFNSGNDMNNVTIKGSTLKGKYCFWVHNYTLADFGTQEKVDAHKALLNFDIFNGTNTFEYSAMAPVLYGFTNSVYFDANGTEMVFDAATLASRLTANVENISVVLGADIELPINTLGEQTGGSGEYKLGGENTKTITVNLNEKLLNVTTTYWSVLGSKNDGALFTIKNGTMTSSQESGTWNSYDLCFTNCDYVFEDVEFNKAIALESAGKNFTLKNVEIKETHDYYAMWISAKGQTVNIEGLTINSDGRAIKIDEQYVNTPSKVVLNVNDATIKSAKKAAIVVKSVEGAEINAENVDITNVAADTEFAVWVDEDAAAYADKVVVNGAYVKVEGEAKTTASTAKELVADLKVEGQTVMLIPSENGESLELGGKISIAKGASLIGLGDEPVGIDNDWGSTTFSNQAHFTNTHIENIFFDDNMVIDAGIANGNVSFKNCVFGGDLAHQGVHFDSGTGVVVFDGCTFVGRNMFGSSLEKVIFNNCTFLNKKSSLTGSDKWTGVNMWGKYEFNNCIFDTEATCNVKCDGVEAAFNGCMFIDDRAINSLISNVSNYSATITIQ